MKARSEGGNLATLGKAVREKSKPEYKPAMTMNPSGPRNPNLAGRRISQVHRMPRLGALVMASILATSMSGCISHTPKTTFGDSLPEFSGVDANGEAFRSSQLAGKIVVIHMLDVGFENESELGFAAMREIIEGLNETPDVVFVTVYRDYSAYSNWTVPVFVNWTVLLDDGQVSSTLGLGAYGETFAAVFDREGIMQIHTTSNSDGCLQEYVPLLHQRPGMRLGLTC